jgi:P-type Ca2+ transporter type 2C
VPSAEAGRQQPDPSLLDREEVVRSQGTNAESGLTTAEAAERLARVGPNRLDPTAEVPVWRRILAQFADPLVYLLRAAIVVSLVAWALARERAGQQSLSESGMSQTHIPALVRRIS